MVSHKKIVVTALTGCIVVLTGCPQKTPVADPPPPPTTLVSANGTLVVPAGVTASNRIKYISPKYPPLAKAAHLQGSVVLNAVISKDGTITNLDVVSSPNPLLTTASVEAVKQWTYKPYIFNGEPTAVDTTITVTFSIGKK